MGSRLRGQQVRVGQTPWKPRAMGLSGSLGPPQASSYAQKGEESPANSSLLTTKAVMVTTASGIPLLRLAGHEGEGSGADCCGAPPLRPAAPTSAAPCTVRGQVPVSQ